MLKTKDMISNSTSMMTRKLIYNVKKQDHTLFLEKKRRKVIILIVYVDNMIGTEDDLDEHRVLKEYLTNKFEVNDLGPLKYFIEMTF